MRVDFKFEPRQKVVTPFGDLGYVSMAAIDDDQSINYYVKRNQGSQYFREDELKERVIERDEPT